MTLKPPTSPTDLLTTTSLYTLRSSLALNITDYYQSSDTNDTQSFVRAAAALSAGGVLEVPAGKGHGTGGRYDITVGALSTVDFPAKVTLRGHGENTKIKVVNAVSTQTRLFGWTDLAIENMLIQGPDSPATTGLLALLQGLSGNTSLRLRDVTLSYAQWLIKSDSGATAHKVQAERCKFLGDGIATAALGAAATTIGIHIPAGAGGAELIVDDCDFDGLGSQTAGPNLNHSIYIYQGTSLSAKKCRFTNHWDGRYIQSFGGSGTAKYWTVEDCYFGVQNVTNVACHTSLGVLSRYVNCTFDNTGSASIQCKGDAVISKCSFNGSYGAGYQVGNYDTTVFNAVIDKCKFSGTNNADIDFNTTGAIDATVSACRFIGAPTTASVRMTASATGTIRVTNNNLFLGSQTAPCVLLGACARATVDGNRFKIASTGRSVQTEGAAAPTVLDVLRNELSQAGGQSVHFPTSPATRIVDGNYGTKGYISRAGGVASKQNAATIAHTIGTPGGTNAAITPTKYGISSAVAGHIAGISAVDATNLTITLTDAAGTNIVVNENVIWWAEA